MKAGGDGDVDAPMPPSVKDAAENEGVVGTRAGSGRFVASIVGEEAFHCKGYNDVNGLAVQSRDGLGALQASAVRGVSGVAVSSRDRCGSPQEVSAREVDGLTVTSENLMCGVLPVLVVRDVNGLRAEVAGLQKDILQMKYAGLEAGSSRNSKSDTCCIYMCLSGMGDTPAKKGSLESILKCQILKYSCIWASCTPSFKVKIQKYALHDALVAGRSAGCFVDL